MNAKSLEKRLDTEGTDCKEPASSMDDIDIEMPPELSRIQANLCSSKQEVRVEWTPVSTHISAREDSFYVFVPSSGEPCWCLLAAGVSLEWWCFQSPAIWKNDPLDCAHGNHIVVDRASA